jgi:hypothetical protein
MYSDISFWRRTKSLRGISRKGILYSCVSEIVVLLYLLDNDTSLLVVVPMAFNVFIEMWKVAKIYYVSWLLMIDQIVG